MGSCSSFFHNRYSNFFHHVFSHLRESPPNDWVAVAGSHSHDMPLSFRFVAAAVCRTFRVSQNSLFHHRMICHKPVATVSSHRIVRSNRGCVGSPAACYRVPRCFLSCRCESTVIVPYFGQHLHLPSQRFGNFFSFVRYRPSLPPLECMVPPAAPPQTFPHALRFRQTSQQ